MSTPRAIPCNRHPQDHVKELLLKYERLVDEKKRALADKIRQGAAGDSTPSALAQRSQSGGFHKLWVVLIL